MWRLTTVSPGSGSAIMVSLRVNSERTALVLGAGGVFGAYQAGVWKALADSFSPDLVVGASIGALNGWIIAGGCSPAALIDLWLNAGPQLRFRPRVPRHWSQGVLDMSAVEGALAEVFERFTPRIEYAAVLTDVFRGKPRLILGPEMTLRHLHASFAVPLAFDFERIEGRVYADGGLLGALPLWAAVELGATRIVAVHSLPEPPAPYRLALSAARWLARSKHSGPVNVETVTIMPEKPLGSFFEMLRYNPLRVAQWIAAGERDALRMKHSIVKCLERR